MVVATTAAMAAMVVWQWQACSCDAMQGRVRALCLTHRRTDTVPPLPAAAAANLLGLLLVSAVNFNALKGRALDSTRLD